MHARLQASTSGTGSSPNRLSVLVSRACVDPRTYFWGGALQYLWHLQTLVCSGATPYLHKAFIV